MGEIEDGAFGTSQKAGVDDHGRLFTRANIVGHMSHHATFHKNASMMVFETTLSGTSETPCFVATNNYEGKDIEIFWLRVSSNADIEFNLYFNNAYSSGGTSKSFENNNLGVSKVPSVSSYEGGASADLVLTTTNEVNVDGVFLAANVPYEYRIEGGIVITPQKTIAIKCIGAATNKVKIMMGFAEHSEGAKL